MYIPLDIVTEILSHLPLKSLARLRCVSKSWNEILTDHKFLKTHFEKSIKKETIIAISPSNSLHAIEVTTHNEYISRKLNFPPHLDNSWYIIRGSCNGVILAWNKNGASPGSYTSWCIVGPSSTRKEIIGSPFLINPTNGNYRQLPLPLGYTISFLGLGYDGLNDDFKVVRHSFFVTRTDQGGQEEAGDSSVYVYSLRSNSWRRIGYSPYNFGGVRVPFPSCVFLHGYLHWIARKKLDNSYLIVSLELSTETFSQVPSKAYINEDGNMRYSLVVLNGYLCLVLHDIVRRASTVMIMKEYGDESSWKELVQLNILDDQLLKPIYQGGDSELVVSALVRHQQLAIYNLVAGERRSFVVDGAPALFRGGWTFVESLATPYLN